MGKITAFRIEFPNSPHAVFHPGDVVSGNVLVDLSSAMKIKAIRIRFRGEAYVHFKKIKVKSRYKVHRAQINAQTSKVTITSHNKTKTEKKTFRRKEREIYYDDTVSIYGKGSEGEKESAREIPAGKNFFSFSIRLKNNLPSSFEGTHGYVRYSMKATLVKPSLLKFDDHTKIAFTVLDLVDLNKNPEWNIPLKKAFTKSYCCCCCKNGPIEIRVQINKNGFVPGEYITIGGSITNFSSNKVRYTKAVLFQVVDYYAENSTVYDQSKIAKTKGPGCPKEKNVGLNMMLRVPSVPPTMTEHCRIIEVKYYLEFTAIMPFGYDNFKTTFEIVIGSVPQQRPPLSAVARVIETSPAQMIETIFSNPDVTTPPLPAVQPLEAALENAVIPPPSYEASASGPVNIKDDDDKRDHFVGCTAFAPQYAFYDYSAPVLSKSEKKSQLPGT